VALTGNVAWLDDSAHGMAKLVIEQRCTTTCGNGERGAGDHGGELQQGASIRYLEAVLDEGNPARQLTSSGDDDNPMGSLLGNSVAFPALPSGVLRGKENWETVRRPATGRAAVRDGGQHGEPLPGEARGNGIWTGGVRTGAVSDCPGRDVTFMPTCGNRRHRPRKQIGARCMAA
jgi:hypothetical protein